MPDQMRPFDPKTNSIAGVRENIAALRDYVDEHHLASTAEALWGRRDLGVRRQVLQHLWDQIYDAGMVEGRKSLRFGSVIKLLETYTSGEVFVSRMVAKSWQDRDMQDLHLYLALYAEPQGDGGPYFSTVVFELHYRDAHDMLPPLG